MDEHTSLLNIDPLLEQACDDAITKWGVQAQLRQTIGEIGEFLDTYGKMGQNREDWDSLAREVADNLIMMLQMRSVYGKQEFDKILKEKVDKFRNKLYS